MQVVLWKEAVAMRKLMMLTAALVVLVAAGSAVAGEGCFGGYTVHVPGDSTVADGSTTDVV